MKIFTLGNGFIANHLPYPKIMERLPIVYDYIESILDKYKPDVVVNCLGKTGKPNIDWCESNREETMNGNVVVPLLVADYCKINKIRLVQIGSGCIFFGKSLNGYYYATPCGPDKYPTDTEWMDTGFKETDFANPQSFYSKSKYACDLMLGELSFCTTLRIRMPISYRDNYRNLINKLKGYKQIIDIPNSMTFVSDLVRCVDWVVQNNITGIYHCTNPQPLTAAQIMREYQKYVPSHQFETIDEQQLDKLTIAKRSNCILNSDKLRNAGFQMTNSKEALEECMANYFYVK
jgi:3,5-epimerase/4-reductase